MNACEGNDEVAVHPKYRSDKLAKCSDIQASRLNRLIIQNETRMIVWIGRFLESFVPCCGG
jgi:hypothetical protein